MMNEYRNEVLLLVEGEIRGVWKTRIANSEQPIVPNSANSLE